MKLKIEHLAPYAPYKLKLINGVVRVDLTAISLDSPFVFITTYLGSREKIMKHIDEVKPILRPLSDLTKEIEVNGEKFFPIEQLDAYHNFSMMHYSDIVKDPTRYPYTIVQRLLELHFDVFGLIPNNLAIDLNSLNK